MKFIYKYIILILISGCANIKPPSGGPPDETPPEIIASVPESGTINFTDKKISVEFSEYVENQSVIRSVVILPKVKTEYKWSGKKFNIEFTEELKSDITYSITFGTEYTDLRKNKPKESYTIIFSPGPKLDSGTINGKVYGKKTDEYNIFAYNITDIDADTLDISKTPPDYSLPLGTEGSFSLKALKDGTYRLICINDTRNNEVYDINQDFIFNASQDFKVINSGSDFAEFKTPQFFDEVPPELSNAKAISERIIELSFNEPIDTNSIVSDAFRLADSANTNNYLIDFAFIKPKEESKIQIISREILDTNKSYQIAAKNEGLFQIADTAGNKINDTLRTAYFIPRSMATDIEPRITGKPFKDSTEKVKVNEKIEFVFNTGINFDNLDIRFLSIEDSSDINFEIINKMNNIIEIKPEKLKENFWYRIYFDTSELTGFNGLPVKDSLVRIDFKTEDRRKYGGMNGKVDLSGIECNNPVLKIINSKKNYSNIQVLDSTFTFNFDKVPAGTYTFEIFCDENENMKIDGGYYYPFQYSEKFYFPVNEVEIKSRWTVDDLMIYVGDNHKNK